MTVKKSSSGSKRGRPPKLKLVSEKPEEIIDKVLHKDGLPRPAYAISPKVFDASTWQLPHHKSDMSVDMALLDRATQLLSRWGIDGVRCVADPADIIQAARHLAEHYSSMGLAIPVSLCVLI